MHYLRIVAIAALIVGGATGPTSAACEPKCTDGDVCRYNAENDTYTCKAPPAKLMSHGQSLGSARDQSSTSDSGTRLPGK
jgi:hypothetical protein